MGINNGWSFEKVRGSRSDVFHRMCNEGLGSMDVGVSVYFVEPDILSLLKENVECLVDDSGVPSLYGISVVQSETPYRDALRYVCQYPDRNSACLQVYNDVIYIAPICFGGFSMRLMKLNEVKQ